MTIFNFSCVCFRKQTNISVTLVSESHVLLHYEKSLYVIINYCLFLIVDAVQNKITNNFYKLTTDFSTLALLPATVEFCHTIYS